MASLHPCASCARHVRASEARCPFCGAVLTSEASALTVGARLGRAALFAFRTTAVAAAMTGCGPTAEPPPETTIAQPYGAPPEPFPPTTVAPPETTTPPPTTTTAPPETTTPPPPETTTTTHHHHHDPAPPTTTTHEPGGPAQGYGGPPFEGRPEL